MNRGISALMVVLIVVVAGGALALGLSGSHSAANSCKSSAAPVSRTAVIQDSKVSSGHVYAKLCDTLTITNKDKALREVAFGAHDRHASYDGVAERVLQHDQSLTITLDKTGTYHWHDHLQDEVEGYFTVTK